MQGNLNNTNNAGLMHFDVVGNGRVILSLLAAVDKGIGRKFFRGGPTEKKTEI